MGSYYSIKGVLIRALATMAVMGIILFGIWKAINLEAF